MADFQTANYRPEGKDLVVETKVFRLRIPLCRYGSKEHCRIIALQKVLDHGMVRQIYTGIIDLNVTVHAAYIQIGQIEFPSTTLGLTNLVHEYLNQVSKDHINRISSVGTVIELDVPNFMIAGFVYKDGILNSNILDERGHINPQNIVIPEGMLHVVRDQLASIGLVNIQLIQIGDATLHLPSMYVNELLQTLKV